MKPEKNQKKKAGNFHKYTEIKQHAPKQPISQRRNQKRN